MSRNKPLAKKLRMANQSGLMLKLTVNLDTDLNLDIGEETVLNYN